MSDDAAGTDRALVADRHAGQDDAVAADPNVAADGDRSGLAFPKLAVG